VVCWTLALGSARAIELRCGYQSIGTVLALVTIAAIRHDASRLVLGKVYLIAI